MTALASPTLALQRMLHYFDGAHRWRSVRIDGVEPEDFYPLPARFSLVKRGGALWLVDSHASSDGGRS